MKIKKFIQLNTDEQIETFKKMVAGSAREIARYDETLFRKFVNDRYHIYKNEFFSDIVTDDVPGVWGMYDVEFKHAYLDELSVIWDE